MSAARNAFLQAPLFHPKNSGTMSMFTKLASFLTIFVETDSGRTDGSASKLLRGDNWQAKLTIERLQDGDQVLTLTVTPQGTLRLKQLGLLFSPKLLPAGSKLIGFGGVQDVNADAPLATKPQIGGFAIGLLFPDGDNWLLGVDAFYDLPTIFSLAAGQLSAGWLGQVTISQTTSWSWRLSRGKDLERLFDDYANSLTKNYPPARHPRLDILTGWNSWDYYGGAISMQAVEKELKAISQSPLRGKLTYFTLDMGWEEFWGDWRPNRRFPARLETIANRIKAHGLTPGLWLAPLQVGLFTELARFRPELFLHYRDTGTPIITSAGSPLGGMLLLDFAKPETQKLVTGWFRQFYDAGFRLFKIDYIYRDALNCLDDSDCPLPSNAFAREILQTIRAGIGDDSVLINCGAPAEAALGLADSIRTSTDIHTFWGHIKNSTRQMFGRAWHHRRFWTCDPDFAIIRHSGNSLDKTPRNMPYRPTPQATRTNFWMAGPEANENELLVWLSVVRLLGGSIFLGDSLFRLQPAALETLAKLFPPLTRSMIPWSYLEDGLPLFWPGPRQLGVFNWSDQPTEVTMPAELHVPAQTTDFWSSKTVRTDRPLLLPAHSGTILTW
jgi:hypothetical protein